MDLQKWFFNRFKSRWFRASTSVRPRASGSASQPTRRRSGLRAAVLPIFSVSACLVAGSCGRIPYNIDDPGSRAATLLDVQKELTLGHCSQALTLITPLYQSKYSDNQIRLYYASAQGCNIGINLYPLLTDISTSDFSSIDAIFKSLVRLFPSTSSDTRLQSAWLATDALLACVETSSTLTDPFVINASSYNPGSVLVSDRTVDSNSYLLFISMALIGNSLNRFGYSSGQSPSGLSYAQGALLPWESRDLIKSDNTGVGCAHATGMLNMFDGIQANLGLFPSNISGAMSNINSLLSVLFTAAGKLQCLADGYLSYQCDAAIERLRSRGACSEQDEAASAAAGIINEINLGWM